MGKQDQIPGTEDVSSFRFPDKGPDPVIRFADDCLHERETVLHGSIQAGVAVQGDETAVPGKHLDNDILRPMDKRPDGGQFFLIHKELGRLDLLRFHLDDLRNRILRKRRTGFIKEADDMRRVETEFLNQFRIRGRIFPADCRFRRTSDFDFIGITVNQVSAVLLQHGL